MVENFFDISKPEQYDCRIRNYGIGHSRLRIRVRNRLNSKDTFYLSFTSVAYYSGPMGWNSANFTVKSDKEMLTILRLIEKFDDRLDEQLLQPPSYRLFETIGTRSIVQIVAIGAVLEK
jgi:hypothetical protein